jgi:hypothetical protein
MTEPIKLYVVTFEYCAGQREVCFEDGKPIAHVVESTADEYCLAESKYHTKGARVVELLEIRRCKTCAHRGDRHLCMHLAMTRPDDWYCADHKEKTP